MLGLAKHKQMRPQRRLPRKLKAASCGLGKSTGEGRLADRRNRKPRPRRVGLQDQLPRRAERLGKIVRRLS